MTTLRAVLDDPPVVHEDRRHGRMTTFGLDEGVLEWLVATLPPGARTLETGSGLSTLAFALSGARHVCLTPDPKEPERLLAYAGERGIPMDGVTFHTAPSERVLPTLGTGALDLVLIDGSHSFPQPFMDWFYTHPQLVVGGHVIVDDTQVWTGRILRDFLRAEPEWSVAEEWFGRSVAFRKDAETDPDRLWVDQPYVARRSLTGNVLRGRSAADMVRAGRVDELVARARGKLGR
jgi:predicted O-methyltransferase YrrM